jgi:hypothetical protein
LLVGLQHLFRGRVDPAFLPGCLFPKPPRRGFVNLYRIPGRVCSFEIQAAAQPPFSAWIVGELILKYCQKQLCKPFFQLTKAAACAILFLMIQRLLPGYASALLTFGREGNVLFFLLSASYGGRRTNVAGALPSG